MQVMFLILPNQIKQQKEFVHIIYKAIFYLRKIFHKKKKLVLKEVLKIMNQKLSRKKKKKLKRQLGRNFLELMTNGI